MRTDRATGTGTEKRYAARDGVATLAASLVMGTLLMFAPTGAVASPQAGAAPGDIVGAWEAQTYLLSTGEEHSLAGKIFFAASDWQVVFFVLDADGTPRRGSAEGRAAPTRRKARA